MVTKRLVEIDDEVLAAAREALATTTITATVNRALQDAATSARRRQFVARAAAGGLPDLQDEAIMADAWR